MTVERGWCACVGGGVIALVRTESDNFTVPTPPSSKGREGGDTLSSERTLSGSESASLSVSGLLLHIKL